MDTVKRHWSDVPIFLTEAEALEAIWVDIKDFRRLKLKQVGTYRGPITKTEALYLYEDVMEVVNGFR